MQKKFLFKKIIAAAVIILAVPCVIGGYFLFGSEKYYITCAILIFLAIAPFFVSFEKKETLPREIGAIAALTAIAVISRGAFYAFPQIKPIAAVVIIGAVSFGCEVGFLTGALSMLLSDIFFGLGMWTPFQMLGLGAVGFLCGLIFYSSKYKNNRFILGLVGGVLTFFVYGITVDTNSVLMLADSKSLKAIAAVYLAGVPMNAVFAVTTALVLMLFGKPFIVRLSRLRTKYGIFERGDNL